MPTFLSGAGYVDMVCEAQEKSEVVTKPVGSIRPVSVGLLCWGLKQGKRLSLLSGMLGSNPY